MATEIDKLDPIPETVKLQSGLIIRLEPLRARQFFKLLRIITHSALPGMADAGLLSLQNLESEAFLGRLMTVVLFAIPDAEEESIEFIRSMCYPDGLIERKGLNKQDIERNQALWEGLDEELVNPHLDDLVTIIEAVIKREAGDIQALGKRLAAMMNLAAKTGQLQASPNPTSTSPSSAVSRGRSTSSRRSTGGRTKSLATSLSDDSGNASTPSESDSTISVGSGRNG